MTKYRVFKKVKGELPVDDKWSEIGTFEAHDPKGAVSAAVVSDDDLADVASETTFSVVAASAWNELTPARVEVETKVRFA